MHRVRARQNDDGLSLVELVIALFVIALAVSATAVVIAQTLKVQRHNHQVDKAYSLTKDVISKAAITPYSNLGFYPDDPGARAGAVQLPVSDSCSGNSCTARVTETQITLGGGSNRPASSPGLFTQPTRTVTVDNVAYRLDTWVTTTSGGAKRVTVQAEWPASDGTCTGSATCVSQSYVRAPLSSEQDPSGNDAGTTCSSPSLAICRTFVQSGRVLSAPSADSATSYLAQDIVLYARTSAPVDTVTATWTWRGTDGSTTTVTIPSSSPAITFQKLNGDATRWRAVIPAEKATDAGSWKQWIRPGQITVNFQATAGGTTTTAGQEARWSYTSNTPITATVVGSPGTCSSTGPGAPTTVDVHGLSYGFGDPAVTPASQSAADVVTATYTVRQGGKTVVVTQPATMVGRTEVYTTSKDRQRGGYVNATFTVSSPLDEACPNTSTTAILNVLRTVDGTTTPFPLQMIPVPAAPTLAAPTVAANLDQPTGAMTSTWTGVAAADHYVVEFSWDGEAWATEGGTSSNTYTTTATQVAPGSVTVGRGHKYRLRVAAVDDKGTQSAWSNIAEVYRPTDVPSPTVTRSGPDTVTASWPAVAGATSYWVTYITSGGTWTDGGTVTTTSWTKAIGQGFDITVAVYANSPGGQSAFGSAYGSLPLWNKLNLLNGWQDYGASWVGARYTRTSAGVVFLSGVIKAGSSDNWTLIGQLPEGYRPTAQLLFAGYSSTASHAVRIDVTPDGRILLVTYGDPGAWSYMSLDGIHFLASDAPSVSRIALPFANGWSNYGAPYAAMESGVDSLGRVHLQGLVAPGSTGGDVGISGVYPAQVPAYYMHLPGTGGGQVWDFYALHGGTGYIGDRARITAYKSIQGMYYPTGMEAGWSPMPLESGWVAYGGGYSPPNFRKAADRVVTLRGLVRAGTPGGTITTLPPGYRPAGQIIFTLPSADQNARVDVLPDGRVVGMENINNAWVALDGISFVAEQ